MTAVVRPAPLLLLVLVVAIAVEGAPDQLAFRCKHTGTRSAASAIFVPPNTALTLAEHSPSEDLACERDLGAVVYAVECAAALYLQTVPHDADELAFIALIPPSAVSSHCSVRMFPVSADGFVAEDPVPLGVLQRGPTPFNECNFSATHPDRLEFAIPTYIPRFPGLWPDSRKRTYVLPFASPALACDPTMFADPPMFELPTLPSTSAPADLTATGQAAPQHMVEVPLDARLLEEHQATTITIAVVAPASTTHEDENRVGDFVTGFGIAFGVFAVAGLLAVFVARRQRQSDLRAGPWAETDPAATEPATPSGYGSLL